MRGVTLGVWVVIFGCGLLSSVRAADDDWDGVVDGSVAGPPPQSVAGASVAIVDTGDKSIPDFIERLATAGYSASLIPPGSGYSVLSQFEMVVLPVSHARNASYDTFVALAADYHAFVFDGGCLYVGQPNPTQGTSTITWVPYHLELYGYYGDYECPPVIDDPSHCVTTGIDGSDLPSPYDTVQAQGPEWTVLASGPDSGMPGLLVASYGAGHVNVDLDNPSENAFCPYTDLGFSRMVECCLPNAPVPTTSSTWGKLKTAFR